MVVHRADLHHPPCPPYQHLFHRSSLDPGLSDFGRSTSALRLNSNQRSRPPLSNCVDFAVLSDSTHRRSSEPLQGRPSARPHDPLLLPTLCPRHRIAFHDTSGKPQSPRHDQSIAPWAETRCLCRPSEVPNGGVHQAAFIPRNTRSLSASLVAQTSCCATLATSTFLSRQQQLGMRLAGPGIYNLVALSFRIHQSTVQASLLVSTLH